MQLLEAKLTAIITIALGTLLVGLIPTCFYRHGRQQCPLLLSTLLCFGGGVLLATSLVHMLPETRAALGHNQDYTEVIYCVGFFILYLIDEIVHFFYGDVHNDDEATRVPSKSPRNNNPSSYVGTCSSFNAKYTYGATERDQLLRTTSGPPPPYNPAFLRGAKSDSALRVFDDDDENVPSQLCHVSHQEPCSTSTPLANFSLLMALSIHALLEGLVVGLESSPSKVLLLLGAIASHKLVVSFCLGIELASSNTHSNTPCSNFISIFVFALGSVGGIGVGMGITSLPQSMRSFTMPLLQGLAGGTLLYVTVSEIIPRERARWHQQHQRKFAGILQFLAIAIGFTTMTVISKYLDYH